MKVKSYCEPIIWIHKYRLVHRCCRERKYNELWFAYVLLLLHLLHGEQKTRQLVFVFYFKISSSAEKIDIVLNCIFLRWTTADDINYSLFSPTTPILLAAEWYGIIPLSFILCVHQIIGGDHFLPPLIPPLPWQRHRFYGNRFHVYR